MLRRAPSVLAGSVLFALAASAARAQPTVFDEPRVEGQRLDWCLVWADSCGQPAADAFCRLQGYREAIRYQVELDVGPTRILGTGQSCDWDDCDGFLRIECLGALSEGELAGERPAPPAAGRSEDGSPEGTPASVLDRVASLEAEQTRLEGANRALRSALVQVRQELEQLRQATRLPRCSEDLTASENPVNGAREECGPYLCSPVSGLCRTACTTTVDQCLPAGVYQDSERLGGAICDDTLQRCSWTGE